MNSEKEIIEFFNKRPKDDDTRILSEKLFKIDNLHALMETWSWDGIYGESIIFSSKEIEEYTDDEVKIKVETLLSKKIESFTMNRKDIYTFFNYNFETGD